MGKPKEVIPLEKLLENIEIYTGDADIKRVLQKFVEQNLIMATGIMIIWTHGKHVEIDGTRFSEPESVWALDKAKHYIHTKGISFDD